MVNFERRAERLRSAYSTMGQPVDFEQMFYRGDRFRSGLRLKRRPSGA